MPSIQILVRVIQSFVTEVPGPFIQGKQKRVQERGVRAELPVSVS
jgi:hypothetical protein